MICLSTFLKDFSSENTGPVSIKFHIQPLGKGGKKIYIFRPGHITKMAYSLTGITLLVLWLQSSREGLLFSFKLRNSDFMKKIKAGNFSRLKDEIIVYP